MFHHTQKENLSPRGNQLFVYVVMVLLLNRDVASPPKQSVVSATPRPHIFPLWTRASARVCVSRSPDPQTAFEFSMGVPVRFFLGNSAPVRGG